MSDVRPTVPVSGFNQGRIDIVRYGLMDTYPDVDTEIRTLTTGRTLS